MDSQSSHGRIEAPRRPPVKSRSGPGLAAALGLVEGAVDLAYPAAALCCADAGADRLFAAVGRADLDTWFDLASLTKALCTSLLALRMCQEGRADLADELLPGVTLADALRHASGLPAWLPLSEQVPSGPARRAAIIQAAAEAPRGPARVRSVYSDLGFILIGAHLEGRGRAPLSDLFAPLAAALEAEVGFRPVGEQAAVPSSRCAPTRGEGPGRPPLCGVVHDDNARAMGGVAGHAGLFGTVRGVSRFARALCDSFQDRDTALRRALGLSPEWVRRGFAGGAVPSSTWGLGWDHPEIAGSTAGSRWSREGVGHLGFTGCSLWMDPAAGRFVVLLANRVDAPTPEAAESARAHLRTLRPALHDAVMEAFAP